MITTCFLGGSYNFFKGFKLKENLETYSPTFKIFDSNSNNYSIKFTIINKNKLKLIILVKIKYKIKLLNKINIFIIYKKN